MKGSIFISLSFETRIEPCSPIVIAARDISTKKKMCKDLSFQTVKLQTS